MKPPKPTSRADRVTLWRYAKLFREDILSAQPERLYGARMAEFRTPFFRSYLINEASLWREVLNARPDDFPKSDRVGAGLRPLLGNSVFLTNGNRWKRQRRIIDPAFEGGRLRDTFSAMLTAAEGAVQRLEQDVDQGPIEIEERASFAAADVIFRTLFSLPIEDHLAARVFREFQAYQRSQPILNLRAFLPLPHWFPRFFKSSTKRSARDIRALIYQLTQARMAQITAGTAPDDLATKIMTTADPETGERFTAEEMVDQVAIFFLAGHETSASALSWALYLLALFPDWQDRVAQEAAQVWGDTSPDFASLGKLTDSRDVFRETLRLYPPVPMMVREAACPETFRERSVGKGSQIVISPWHLHRHTRIWDRPDAFDPTRWQTDAGKACAREAYLPFSSGARVCPGAGFAMIEGPLFLSMLVRRFRCSLSDRPPPVPVAHLTVRSKNGIYLNIAPR
jgi:cytochrome P450